MYAAQCVNSILFHQGHASKMAYNTQIYELQWFFFLFFNIALQLNEINAWVCACPIVVH